MSEPLSKDSWLWVIVMDPDSEPQYLGQQDEDTSEAYVPAFLNKEDAQQGLVNLSIEKGKKIEVQAVLHDQLTSDAASHNFEIFVLSAQGAILERIPPTAKK